MDFDDERQIKRRKLGGAHGPPTEIKRVEDLQNALVFRKSSSPEVKKGMYFFTHKHPPSLTWHRYSIIQNISR